MFVHGWNVIILLFFSVYTCRKLWDNPAAGEIPTLLLLKTKQGEQLAISFLMDSSECPTGGMFNTNKVEHGKRTDRSLEGRCIRGNGEREAKTLIKDKEKES